MHPDAPRHAGVTATSPQPERLADAIVRAGGYVPEPMRGRLFALPVREVLQVYALAAPRVPRKPEHLRYGREVIGVPEPELDVWYTQAWWGTYAANACMNRLAAPKREQEVFDLVAPVDWGPLDALQAGGKGVVLCAAHWGVSYVITGLLRALGRTPLQVGVWFKRYHLPGTDLSEDSQTGLTRIYLQAFRHLREGGIALIAPDGGRWREGYDERFFGHPCRVSRAPAALARLTAAPALPALALWDGDRIRVDFGAPNPHEGGDADAADRRWTRRYLDWLEGAIRAHPRAVRFDQLHPKITLPPERADVDR